MGEFDVVTVALCDAHVLSNFVQHYTYQGANNIRIYYDSDRLPADIMIGERCVITLCDAEFWSNVGITRPSILEERQRHIYSHAYNICRSKWCLIVDIDEYVFGNHSLSHYLKDFDGDYESIRFMCAEACYIDNNFRSSFINTVYRTAIPKYWSPIISTLLYGRYAKIFSRGLLGHSRGKQAIRSGIASISIDIHDARAAGENLTEHNASSADRYWIAHFDAINFDYWCEKFQGRLDRQDVAEAGLKRDIQLGMFAECKTQAEKRRLFKKLYYLPSWKINALKAFGYIKFSGPFAY